MSNEQPSSNPLLQRCLEVVQDHLCETTNEAEQYRDYPSRFARYERRIKELETLVADIEEAIKNA